MKKVFIRAWSIRQALVELMKNGRNTNYILRIRAQADGIVKARYHTEVAVESRDSKLFPDIIINCAAMTAVTYVVRAGKAYNINALVQSICQDSR